MFYFKQRKQLDSREMAESDVNPCGICIRIILVFINMFYLLLACGLSGLGIFFLVKEGGSDYYFGGVNIIGVSITIMVVGVVIFFTAVIGIIGSVGNFWPLLSLYSVFIFLIIVGQLAGAVLVFIERNNLEDEIDTQILGYIKNYTTSDSDKYNEATNDAINLLQTTFKCCGLTGPGDWFLFNPKYVIKNGLPDSCTCEGDSSKCQTILYSSVGVWKKGCNETVYEFAKDNLIALGSGTIGFALLELLTLFLSVGLCCCALSQSHNHSRYARMRNIETRHDPLQATGLPWSKSNEEFQTGYSNVVV